MLSVALGFAFSVVVAAPDVVDAGANAHDFVDAGANAPLVEVGSPHEVVDSALERATDQLDKTLALKSGPGDVDLVVATIHVPEGVVFTDAHGAEAWEKATNNASSHKEVALLGLKSNARVLVEWADVGTVSDDDAAELDQQRDTLLTRIKAAATKPLVVDTWLRPPTYDAKTHDLSWCVSTSTGFDCAHRILGRRGFVAISLLGDSKVSRANAEAELADLMHPPPCPPPSEGAMPPRAPSLDAGTSPSEGGGQGGGCQGFTWKTDEAFGSARKDGDVDAGYGLSALVSSGAPVPVAMARHKLLVGPRARVLAAAAIGAIVAALAGARSARRRMRGASQ